MKRITVLLLALALTLGSIATAKADGVDVKVKGNMWFTFGWVFNEGFRNSYNRSSSLRNRDRSRDALETQQRLRTQINFIINEYLQGVAHFELTAEWGRPGAGQINADTDIVLVKHLYLDWLIPYTDVQVRMGIQPIALPSGPIGNPVLTADVAGITISKPIANWLSATFVWARPFNQYWRDNDYKSVAGSDTSRYDETDAFALILPMSFKNIGLGLTPWFMWANVGAASGYYDYAYGIGGAPANAGLTANSVTSNDRAAAWWLGLNLKFDLLDPLVFNFDAMYGSAGKNNLEDFTGIAAAGGAAARAGLPPDSYIGTRGWYLGASLDYKLDFGNGVSMVPGIFAWWGSGDSEGGVEDGQLGRLPHVSTDSGSGFHPTTFGTGGAFGRAQWGDGGLINTNGSGSWGVGIQLAKVTFIKDLSHTLRFAYIQGTNDDDLVRNGGPNSILPYGDDSIYLTTKDKAFEINFDHTYKIYENLTAVLELGWIHLSTDEDVWGNGNRNAVRRTGAGHDNEKSGDNAWKAQLHFLYSF